MKFQMSQPIEPTLYSSPDGKSHGVFVCIYTYEAQQASSGGPTRFLKNPLRAQKKTQRAHHAHANWLGVWFACSLGSAFSVLARSLRSS